MIKSPALFIAVLAVFVLSSCQPDSNQTKEAVAEKQDTGKTDSIPLTGEESKAESTPPNVLLDDMDLSKLETPMAWQEKASKLKQVVEEIKSEVNQCTPDDDWDDKQLEAFYSLFHFMDINMDGIQDVLFNDALCTDADMPALFLGTPTGFKTLMLFPFDGAGSLAGINPNKDFTEIKLLEFTPCGYETLYNLKLKGMEIDTVYSAYVSGVSLPPKSGIEKVVLTTKNTWLRFEPFKRDTGTTDLCEEYKGNRIMQLKKGTKLKVMAETKDKTGAIWYFVFAPGWKPKLYIAGWVKWE